MQAAEHVFIGYGGEIAINMLGRRLHHGFIAIFCVCATHERELTLWCLCKGYFKVSFLSKIGIHFFLKGPNNYIELYLHCVDRFVYVYFIRMTPRNAKYSEYHVTVPVECDKTFISLFTTKVHTTYYFNLECLCKQHFMLKKPIICQDTCVPLV